MEPAERLNSWKEIAAYLEVSLRTVQRWETMDGMPARRHRHAVKSSVFAYRSELDAWWNSRPDLKRLSQSNQTAVPSIAVLPFMNLSRDEENEILCDGLTEELINALTQVEGLHVVARTSAFHFKGYAGDVRTVGAQLGVRTILEGSVRREGNRLRVTAQLINVEDGCHLCSERLDRRMTDLFELQEEIARAIVDTLRVKLAGPRVIRQYSNDVDAYTLYLEGRYHWNKRTPAGFLKAVECFELALARDARMAPAWAGLADCYAVAGPVAVTAIKDLALKAKAAALKALEIDSTLAEAHASLGFIAAATEYDWRGGEEHFRRALGLNPRYAYAHALYAAAVLAPAARLEEAGVHVRSACDLDPFSAVMIGAMGLHWVSMRQFDRAIFTCKRALELDPGYPWAYRGLGQAYLMKRIFAEATGAFLRIQAPVFAAGFLGYCYARSGREPDARHLLRELEQPASPLLAYQIAALHLGLGDRDAAFARLNEACEAHCPGVHWVKTDPIWDELRPDSRFGAVLKKMGLGD